MWAKTKLLIEDDLLRPMPNMKIKLENINTEKLYKEIPKLALSVFKSHRDSIQEKVFKWAKGDTHKFKVVWEIDKDLDRFSYYFMEIELEGTKDKSGKGNASITIAPSLRTEYPQDTWWHRSLLYEFMRMLWHTLFYTSKRDQYIKEGRRLTILFIEKLKESAGR